MVRLAVILLVGSALAGCGRRRTPEQPNLSPDGIRFMARSGLEAPGDTLLYVQVRAVNDARAPRTLEWGACTINVRISTLGPPPVRVWDYVAFERALTPKRFCPMYLVTRDLSPGDSVSPAEYLRRIPVRRILGDSLPPGRYRATARVGTNGRSSGDIDGGEIELRPPPARPR